MTDKLPPLPKPDHFAFIDGAHGIYVEGGPTGEPFFSAEQMHVYAAEAVRAALAEQPAKREPESEKAAWLAGYTEGEREALAQERRRCSVGRSGPAHEGPRGAEC